MIIFCFLKTLIFSLDVVDLDFISKSDNNFEIELKKSIQTPEISIPEIFQINKQLINNKHFINLRTNNYVVSFPFSENFIDLPINIEESINQMDTNIFAFKGFDSTLMDMKVSNFFSEQNYILTAQNSIYLLEDGRSSILLNSDKNKFGAHHSLYCLENSHHPKNLYLMSTERIYNFDQRTSKPQEVISKDNDLQRFFGVKHYNDQFILLSTSKTFSFYDVRYPKNPVLEFRHFSEESPPTILDFSTKISDFSRNVSSFESDIHNMEILEKYAKNYENNKKLLLAFSPAKSGSLIANIFDQDLFEDGNNKDLLKMLEISKEPIFSFKKFQNPMVPLLLYSNNMKFDKYKIAGVSCQSILNDLNLVFQSDNLGGLSIQILKNENNKLNHLALNFKEQEGIDDLIDLEEVKFNRLFEKNQEKKLKIQIKFDYDDNDFDDFSMNEELDDLAQQFEERILKFRNLDKIFKKLLRESNKKDFKNISNNNVRKLEFPEERTQDTMNTKVTASQMNLEDMIFGLTTEELTKERKKITNYFNENFLMTEELEEHLKTKWDEEK